MSRFRITLVFLLSCLLGAAGAVQSAERMDRVSNAGHAIWSVDDLLQSPTPFALGHRGYGANKGEDPTRPIENTLKAFRKAFDDGIRVVELDLQQTADGKIVVFHDDYLPDFTCVSSLTYGELHANYPEVPLFRAMLNTVRHYGHADDLSGVIFAEIKVPIPLCDGANTSELAEASESALVAEVIADIRRARMEDRVILNAGSPTILHQAALQAPEIKRALSLNILQLLPPDVVAGMLGLPVVLIPKDDFGLAWYNVGPIARLPAMTSFEQFIGVSLATGSAAVSLDKTVLLQAGAAAPALVGALHGVGIKAIVWTVDDEAEWAFVEAAGADGITTNNIAMGLANQAQLAAVATMLSSRHEMNGTLEAVLPRLMLGAPRSNPSRDGTVRVSFALPDAGSARLTLVDIAGRVIESRDVGTLGAGRHDLALGGNLTPGVYFVRLSHAQGQYQVKAVVAR